MSATLFIYLTRKDDSQRYTIAKTQQQNICGASRPSFLMNTLKDLSKYKLWKLNDFFKNFFFLESLMFLCITVDLR